MSGIEEELDDRRHLAYLIEERPSLQIQRRARQRNMNLRVKADGTVWVSCNFSRTTDEIEAFVRSCADFIAKRRAKIAEMDRLYPRPQFLSGETFLYFGQSLPLDVIWSWEKKVKARRLASGFELLAPVCSLVEERKMALAKVYRSEARAWLEARLRFFSGLMGVVPVSLSVRGQRTLWGSCTGPGAISLNWKLLACPPEVIDYVVVHELAHIRHRNHSSVFWEFVARFDPKYKEHRRFLKSVEPVIARMFP